MSQLIYETDWLASKPYFYNPKTGQHNENINYVMPDKGDFAFHADGLYNYLDFGYSVFEQSPINNVKFMRHSSRLWKRESGELHVEYLPDPVEQYLDYRLSETDIVDLIRSRVQSWERSLGSDQEIILPLSGGYDSRLLLWCIEEKDRVRTYTYGVSQEQSKSREVVFAREIAKRLGVCWEQVGLGDFHNYFLKWHQRFGVSTHAHGMYHFEFYSNIRKQLSGTHSFLSGIVGDLWAGSLPYCRLDGVSSLNMLGYTHGMRANPESLVLHVDGSLRHQFWDEYKYKLKDQSWQLVEIIRLKIILLSYLLEVPKLFGFETWTPYLDIDIAMAMLNLPNERRKGRRWQRDFFAMVGLDLEAESCRFNDRNSLNITALKRVKPQPLNHETMSALFEGSYVDWINRHIEISALGDIHRRLLSVPKVGGLLRRLHFDDPTLRAYFAYLCLRPIENLLRLAESE